MFIDLLVLADSSGAVDMTVEAIARRTNVPVNEVRKYIEQLCQPDPLSRSPLAEGKRLIPLDSGRDWGWQVVNFQHYRKLRDEEARRAYFRDTQRKYRAKQKALKDVKDTLLTGVDKVGQVLTSASASASSSFWEELKRNPLYKGIDIEREFERARQWCQRKKRRLTERFFINWLNKAERDLARPPSKPKPHLPPRAEPTEEQLELSRKIAAEEKAKLKAQLFKRNANP